MRQKGSFDFDISVSADKKRRAKKRGSSGAVETSGHKCEASGCTKSGKYRAPKSPDLIDEYHWFCLEHVREYNLKWNFFKNHNAEDLEKQVKEDAVWSRKTKPIGLDNNKLHTEGRSWARLGFDDPHDVLGDKGTADLEKRKKSINQRRLPLSERKALEILDAKDTMNKEEIRKVYKALVKDLHPDMNGGRRDDEDRLAEVVWAWEQIRSSLSFKQ